MANMSPTVAPLLADDLSRRATLFDPDDPSLTHLAIGPGTYTIPMRGSDTGGA